jgi:hypothetical protein
LRIAQQAVAFAKENELLQRTETSIGAGNVRARDGNSQTMGPELAQVGVQAIIDNQHMHDQDMIFGQETGLRYRRNSGNNYGLFVFVCPQ